MTTLTMRVKDTGLNQRMETTVRNLRNNLGLSVERAAERGWALAQQLAPTSEGDLRQAIIVFPVSQEAWSIVSQQPKGIDDPLGLHVAIEQGNLRALRGFGWGSKTAITDLPKTGQFHFMRDTARSVRDDFFNDAQQAVGRAIS